ncbi:DUF2141 domain-containing protein [Spirosoma sp. KNUC1025]|uniref:DUF2141 domain-containing protein n=1 Tax=Spirosoma sp. KNUC1025 TaxID=2894082 RepID=UPI0038649205|nr:DUF2141 domain-containing protein [Spirosoma sp. KNUC1025]
MFHWVSLFSLFLTTFSLPPSPPKASLKVDVHNVQTLTGAVYIALFKPGKEFPDGKPIEGKKLNATSHSVQTTFSIDPGEYAVAVFHDENGNGKMDKRIFGIPKEPYGFSNNFRPKMSAPKFSDCQFTLGEGGKSINITVK